MCTSISKWDGKQSGTSLLCVVHPPVKCLKDVHNSCKYLNTALNVILCQYSMQNVYFWCLPKGTLAAEASGLIQNDNQDSTTINRVGA